MLARRARRADGRGSAAASLLPLEIQTGPAGGFEHVEHRQAPALEVERAATVRKGGIVGDEVVRAGGAAHDVASGIGNGFFVGHGHPG